ncbi:MAG: aldehyde dehydrogenase [Gammaproteobacteria bacterium]|nr:aldehyde dehydrogenase [Gammaproteobacteria bacterium]
MPDSGDYLESIDPASGEAWASFARGNAEDADIAVNAAQRAFSQGPWADYSMQQRHDCLLEIADLLEQRWPELVEAEIRDNGKRIAEINPQFAGLHSWYRYFARQGLEIEVKRLDNQVPGIINHAHYLPYGVVVAITPWNSPLMIAAWKIAPALAAGNTMVIKPSEFASASTLEFVHLLSQTSLPAGVVNVVTGLGHEVGEPLVTHPLTRKVTFTGSDVGGRKVAEAAAGGVIPTTLELGGKSPQLLFADADLDNAVNGIISGIFLSNGQTCVAGSRLIVESSIHDEVVERLVARVDQLQAGDPMDVQTEIAPLANRAHLDKVLSMIAEAREQGANCVCGGERQCPPARPHGFYVQPTVFTDVSTDMTLWREEVFGPVLAVIRCDSEAQAVTLANDSKYGLAAGIWTSDVERANRIAARLTAGTVYVNHYRSVDPGSPIGGFKASGYGRELGPDAVRDFMQIKSVWVGTAPCANPFPPRSG